MAGAHVLVISGTVVDSSHRPVAGARVALATGPSDLPDIAALTGDDGGFSFGVTQPGVYLVEAHSDLGRGEVEIEVRPGQPAWVRVVLTPG